MALERRSVTLFVGGNELSVLPGTQITEETSWLPTISAQVNVPASEATDARRADIALLTVKDTPGSSHTWKLIVRRCETDYRAGIARLTLESTDVITLANNNRDEVWGATNTALVGINGVRMRMDPSDRLAVRISTRGNVPDHGIGDGEAFTWPASETATSAIARMTDRVDSQIVALRNGNWVIQHRDYNITPTSVQTITDETLLNVTHLTALDDYYNSVVQDWGLRSDLTVQRETRTLQTGPTAPQNIGLRSTYRGHDHAWPNVWRDRDTDSFFKRVMTHGDTWQIEAVGDLTVQPGTWIRVNSSAFGIDITQRVERVTHTSDGIMTLNLQLPEVI